MISDLLSDFVLGDDVESPSTRHRIPHWAISKGRIVINHIESSVILEVKRGCRRPRNWR